MENSPDNIRDDIFLFCEQKKFQEARVYFENNLISGMLDINNVEHLLWQSSIEGLSGNLKLEQNILLSAYELNPTYTAVLFALLRSLLKSKQFFDCTKIASELLDVEKELHSNYFSESVQFYLAVIYLHLKERQNFTQAIAGVDADHREWILEKLWSKEEMLLKANELFDNDKS